jgi:hypothetical protein
MERLQRIDECFTHNNCRDPTIIMGVLKTTKFEYNEMVEFMSSSLKKMDRARSLVNSFMGRWYFTKMTSDQWEERKDKLFVKLEGIHTKEQIQ